MPLRDVLREHVLLGTMDADRRRHRPLNVADSPDGRCCCVVATVLGATSAASISSSSLRRFRPLAGMSGSGDGHADDEGYNNGDLTPCFLVSAIALDATSDLKLIVCHRKFDKVGGPCLWCWLR